MLLLLVAAAALERAVVIKVMTDLRPKVQACRDPKAGDGFSVLDLTIEPSGSVSRAEIVSGYFAATSPTGACLLQVTRAARFPAFDGAAQTIAYPFVIQK